MLFVDDFSVVGVIQGIFPELLCNLLFQGFHQPGQHLFLAQDEVRGHAGLAAVEEFSEHNPPGGKGNGGGVVHDAGTLSAQFQHHRGQVLCRLPQHLLAYGLAAGEEDEVKLLLKQGCVFCPAAGNHRHQLRREAGGNQFPNHLCGVGGVGAGLDHGGVSRGDGGSQRLQGKKEWIVPGAHNQGVAVGGGLAVAPGGKLGKGCGDGFLPGKPSCVAEEIGDFREGQTHLAHIAFIIAFSQILGKGLADGIFPALDFPVEPPEHFQAEVNR